MPISDYVNELNKSKFYPKTVYEHAYTLIDSERSIEKEQSLSFSDIVDKHIQLTNISNDPLMRLYQNDIILLTHMFDMARRDKSMAMIFNILYNGWRGELLMTNAKNGARIKLQTTVGTSYQPKENLYGYGQDMLTPQEQPQREKKKNIIEQIFNRG